MSKSEQVFSQEAERTNCKNCNFLLKGRNKVFCTKSCFGKYYGNLNQHLRKLSNRPDIKLAKSIRMKNNPISKRPEVALKISNALKGRKLTEEHKEKIRLGCIKGARRGENNYLYGHPERNPFLGKHHTTEVKRKLSELNRLEKHPQWGWHRTEEQKRSSSELNKSEKNPQWVGDKVSYKGLHSWVRRNKVKQNSCNICNKVKLLDLANISGQYKRDLNDFEWLCRRCHMTLDGRIRGWRKNEKHKKKRPDV